MCGCNKRKKQAKKEVCTAKLKEFSELRDKVLFLINKSDNPILKNFKEDIELWIREASIKCPSQDSYDVTKKFIENEYTKYNS